MLGTWTRVALIVALGTAALTPLAAQQTNTGRRARPAVEADGTTPLHRAVEQRDAAAARRLIQSGVDVNAANRYGVAPLVLATENADTPMMRVLIEAGARVTAVTGTGQTLLMTAARTGNVEAIRLLAARGADVNAKEAWLGETALMFAAASNQAPAVQALVELGAKLDDKSSLVEFPEQKFTTSGMVTTYLNRGGWTALMFAAREGARDSVRALIAARAGLDLADDDGATAMVLAVINGHFGTADLILQAGANPNVLDKVGMGALYATVEMNTLDSLFGRPMPTLDEDVSAVEFARRLIAKGADVNAALKAPTIQRHHNAGNAQLGDGTTPLFRAAKNGDGDLMRILLDSKARIDVTLKDKTTVLMMVVSSPSTIFSTVSGTESGAVEAVRLCLQSGVDVNAVNDRGQTAVHLAAAAGKNEVIRALAQGGAKLDIADAQGLTPLDLASGRSAGGGRRGGGGGNNAAQPRPETIALLRELLGPQAPAAPASQPR